MPRVANITVPPNKTSALIEDLKNIEGIIEVHLQKGVSISPPGDVVTVQITTSTYPNLMRKLDGYGLGKPGGISLTTSDPDSIISTGSNNKIDRDTNEASWEEMEMIISKDSNSTLPTLLIMILSGILATVGIANNSIHIVIGGMLIAPGFMPIMRVSLSIITENRNWYWGIIDTLKVYLALLFGAALTTIIFLLNGKNPLETSPSYYQLSQPLVSYWTTVTFSSILASGAASLAGALLIATKRSVFTSGVMIGLALVPSASIIAIALVLGETEMAGKAFYRWIVDVGLIIICSLLIFFMEKIRTHKRKMNLT